MTYQRQVSRMLDDEHRANLELLGRVEQAFARGRGVVDSGLASLCGAIARHLEREVDRHFEFEEREIFPRMTDAGDGDMADLLREEHDAIRAVAVELLPLSRRAASGTLDDAGWRDLTRCASELVERESAHIQKETAALLPLVEDMLDEDADCDLAFDYAATA